MISVLILIKNESLDLLGALASLAWSDDTHLLDSFSTDSTVAIWQYRAGEARHLLQAPDPPAGVWPGPSGRIAIAEAPDRCRIRTGAGERAVVGGHRQGKRSVRRGDDTDRDNLMKLLATDSHGTKSLVILGLGAKPSEAATVEYVDTLPGPERLLASLDRLLGRARQLPQLSITRLVLVSRATDKLRAIQ
jgi:hypothetical protein